MFRHSCEAGIENAFGNCEAVYKCGFGQLQTTANVSWLLAGKETYVMFRHSCGAGIENAFGNCEAVYKCGFGQLQTTANVSWLLAGKETYANNCQCFVAAIFFRISITYQQRQ